MLAPGPVLGRHVLRSATGNSVDSQMQHSNLLKGLRPKARFGSLLPHKDNTSRAYDICYRLHLFSRSRQRRKLFTSQIVKPPSCPWRWHFPANAVVRDQIPAVSLWNVPYS
jgi:hypothetical protein